jgi:hypothetical protein
MSFSEARWRFIPTIVLTALGISAYLGIYQPWQSDFTKELKAIKDDCRLLQNTTDINELGRLLIQKSSDRGKHSLKLNQYERSELSDEWTRCTAPAIEKYRKANSPSS